MKCLSPSGERGKFPIDHQEYAIVGMAIADSTVKLREIQTVEASLIFHNVESISPTTTGPKHRRLNEMKGNSEQDSSTNTSDAVI